MKSGARGQCCLADACLPLIAGLQEGWEPGQAFRDMDHRLAAIAQQRADIEEARKVGYFSFALSAILAHSQFVPGLHVKRICLYICDLECFGVLWLRCFCACATCHRMF